MNRTTFIFSIIVLLVGVLFIGCTPKPLQNSPLSSKYWENYYRVHLTPGSKVIEASTNRTVELIDGRYIVQEYFYDDRILTSRMIYTDAALTNREGAFQLFYDTGRKNREGTFQNGKREGEVLVYEMDEGFLESKAIFKDGKLNGPVFEYNKYGKVVSQSFFVQDSLHGVRMEYDSLGNITKKWVYDNGNLMSSDPPGILGAIPHYDVLPQFPCNSKWKKKENCGESALFKFLGKNIHYPKQARDLGIQGRAIVRFDVDVDGSIQNIRVLKGLCSSIRDECYRVVSAMPKWTPAYEKGQPVKSSYILPISYRLE